MGTLYYGDNLDILRRYVKAETVDLAYLDPPFNSDAAYNAFFPGKTGAAASQIKAFEDTWRWINKDNASLNELRAIIAADRTPDAVKKLLAAYHDFMGGCDMMAYLTMMAPRLVELHRVLKPTGSLYLHCDPTASHYLKLLLDAVFGPGNFRNEIIWKRTGSHGGAKRWGPIHDVILFYAKSDKMLWNRVYQDYDEDYVADYYRFEDEKGKYQLVSLTGAQTRTGDSGEPWRGINPTKIGRHWAVPSYALKGLATEDEIAALTTQQKLDLLDKHGFIYWPQKGSVPRQKRYLTDGDGVPIQDIVTDIQAISSQAKERLGYPTQKPVALLKRIIAASSNPGGVVLDPFCGCGTTIDAAEELGREWIGIDITQVAISTIKDRLVKRYQDTKKIVFLNESDPEPVVGRVTPRGGKTGATTADAVSGDTAYNDTLVLRVFGEPATPEDAAVLAKEDEYGFQWWVAYNLVGGQGPKKKGGDGGIDGKIIFFDDPNAASGEEIILQIKGGKLKADDVRALGFVVEREQAAMGVLISVEPPTEKMYADASTAGDYTHKLTGQKYPKLQLRTVKELMEGKGILRPSESAAVDKTFKSAPKAKAKPSGQKHLGI